MSLYCLQFDVFVGDLLLTGSLRTIVWTFGAGLLMTVGLLVGDFLCSCNPRIQPTRNGHLE